MLILESLENTPIVDELKCLLKKGGRRIFKSCDISLENMPASLAVSRLLHLFRIKDEAYNKQNKNDELLST